MRNNGLCYAYMTYFESVVPLAASLFGQSPGSPLPACTDMRRCNVSTIDIVCQLHIRDLHDNGDDRNPAVMYTMVIGMISTVLSWDVAKVAHGVTAEIRSALSS